MTPFIKKSWQKVKADFPIFSQKINGQPLVYLDSTASTQKPRAVIDAVKDFYETYYANVHRGIYTLSEKASEAYELVRQKVAQFINASSATEIIFTRNATESINLVAFTWGRQNIKRGDRIVLTEMEHHANLVPWQVLAKEKGAQLAFIPVAPNGRLDISHLDTLLAKQTKLVAFTHMSNVLGTINPAREMVRQIRKKAPQAVVLVDGAQSAPHFQVDMKKIDADFYVFSSHKMLGPTGVGVLYGKHELLEHMPPFLTGGDMISHVTLHEARWNDLPWKFEAGTPNIAGTIGFGAAIDYLQAVGMERVFSHEQELTALAIKELTAIPGLTIYGPREVKDRGGAVSFSMKDIHPHDLASILDEQGVAVRAGHHCAQPLHEILGVESTTRASFYLYNTEADVQSLANALKKAKELFNI
ncbi:MAG: cysteine desulfurase [Patescibacteria group bacterium]|jgi:cysteine desulfurase/selenocysteine lyase